MIEERMMVTGEVSTGLCLNCGCAYGRDQHGRVWEPGEPPETGCLEGGRCRCHMNPHQGCAVSGEWTCDNPEHSSIVI
jgi:hypothetical protein